MLTSPLAILAIVLVIILLIPVISRTLHVPSIVGFILAGIAIGPNGLSLLTESQTIDTLGKLGMLYIMLQAGIEIDRNDFSRHRRASVVFGLMSFVLPFGLGMVTSHMLGYGWSTGALLGAMYGSHTLMTYPIVGRYGLQKQPAVNIVVGGTMVAITLSLLTLAGLKSHLLSANEPAQIWRMIVRITLFVAVTIGLIPRIAQWSLKRNQDATFSFMLVMTMLVVSAWLADWAGLEGILGAFVCGTALNAQVPNRSPLMQRINFVGNSIFVPVFLIGVGMLIDIRLCWSSWGTLLIAATMILTKLTGKWLAAWLSQVLFRLSGVERRLIFGLTHATAAGTLAIVTIGYQIGLFDAQILNASVVMILVLCTLSSFVTEQAAKQLALREEARLTAERQEEGWVLASVGESIMDELHELSHLSELHESEYSIEPNWDDVRRLAERTERSMIIYHPVQPIGTVSRLMVAVPRYAEKEHDFISCFGQIRRLSSQIGAKVVFYCTDDTRRALEALCSRKDKYLRATYREMGDWEEVLMIAKEIEPDDMLVFITARHATASYHPLFDQNPDMLARFFTRNSYMLIYPEQITGRQGEDILLTEQVHTSTMWRILSTIKRQVINTIRRILERIQTR